MGRNRLHTNSPAMQILIDVLTNTLLHPAVPLDISANRWNLGGKAGQNVPPEVMQGWGGTVELIRSGWMSLVAASLFISNCIQRDLIEERAA